MDESFWNTIAGTAVGAALSWLAAAYYYRRKPNVKLALIVATDTVLLRGVDEDVREGLSIQYGDRPIANLTQIELVVANRGSVAIGAPVRPLTMTADLDSSWDLLDVAVVGQSVQGIGARVERADPIPHVAEIRFDLLNPNDYFRVKVLLDGEYSIANLSFTITAQHIDAALLPISARNVAPRGMMWARLLDVIPFVLAPGAILWLAQLIRPIWPFPTFIFQAILVAAFLASFYYALKFVVRAQDIIKSRDQMWEDLR